MKILSPRLRERHRYSHCEVKSCLRWVSLNTVATVADRVAAKAELLSKPQIVKSVRWRLGL